MGGFDNDRCDGCTLNTPHHKRAYWQVCDPCMHAFDEQKATAKSKLLLTMYTPDAHLWRISGQAYGETGEACSSPFTIKTPILIERICKWCAIHDALMTVDPWAFAYTLNEHGECLEHSRKDINDDLLWMGGTNEDGNPTGLVVEDLGIIGEDRWGRRLDRPRLIGARR
jgi:hypothetical protein